MDGREGEARGRAPVQLGREFYVRPGSGRDGRGDERVGQEGQAGWEGETRDVGSEQATSNGR